MVESFRARRGAARSQPCSIIHGSNGDIGDREKVLAVDGRRGLRGVDEAALLLAGEACDSDATGRAASDLQRLTMVIRRPNVPNNPLRTSRTVSQA